MVKIHGIFYIIMGAGILIASYKIDSQKFKLFIWLGYLFLIIGVMKLGIWFVKRKGESPVERRAVGRDNYGQATQRQRVVQQRAMYCPRCGNMLSGNENFCSRCGTRVQLR